MTDKSFTIHGHFYQPPREDPFSGLIPPEPGAEPFLNWNERIHAECYWPNANLGNFEQISFNVGPTLFEWMHNNHPQTSEKLVQQDQNNVRRYGIGNAIAQSYHHTILPLANREDKEIQVYWGVKQFEHRFKRKPMGIWLPETAVDLETLDILAKHDIQFTILAPWQADREEVDCTEPYQVLIGPNKTINVFFYQRELSTGISFEPQMTTNADEFVNNHLVDYYNPEKTRRGEPQLLLIASDGELYGHHQTFRDMFLSQLVNGSTKAAGIRKENLASWLRQHPPRQSVTIRERTSWSCMHGVTRWGGDCDCIAVDGRWKMNLRDACDILAAEVDNAYKAEVKKFGLEPLELLKGFIEVLVGNITVNGLIAEVAGGNLKTQESNRIALLLKASLMRQKMYTSCAWFFDDFSRIEPRNCLAYAAQSAAYVRQATGVKLDKTVQESLAKVSSQKTGLRGDRVFNQAFERACENGT